MLTRRAIVSAWIAAVAGGCDAETRPLEPEGGLPQPAFQTITQPTITVTLNPTSSNHDLPRDSVVAYKDLTLATITASGLLQIFYSSAPGWGSNAGTLIGPWDAGGKVGGDLTCSGNVYVGVGGSFLGFCDQTNAAPQDTWSVHGVWTGTFRVGWDRGPVTSTGFCDGPGLPTCYTYTGSHTVRITPEPVDFDVTASPTTVNFKDTVAVTITVVPAQVYGLTVPWKVDSTKWAPAFGTQTAPCQWSDFVVIDAGTRRCRKPFTRSGTLTVYTTVNGAKAQKALSIVVTPPTLKVTATPRYLAGTQSVTFTATLTPSGVAWNLSTWLFIPDSGAINSGISPTPCQWSDNPCTRTISKSGWMKATATVGEYPLADSMHVSVVPCLTGDSILDDSRIRRKLSQAWNNSNPNGPGNQRQEQFGMRVTLPDGRTVDTNFTNLPGGSPCQAYDPALFDPRSVGQIILTWHTHPFEPAHYVPGVGWVVNTPAELLPYPGCATGPNSAALPEPSLKPDTTGDRNQPWPQIIVDKTNAYWIEHPAPDFSQVMNVKWQTKRRSTCDILRYF